MLSEGLLRLRTPFETLRIRAVRVSSPPSPEERRLGQRALVEIRSRVEANDPRIFELVRQLLDPAASTAAELRSEPGLLRSRRVADALVERLEQELTSGRIRVLSEERDPLPDLPEDPIPEPPPLPPPSAEGPDTFFDVRFMDETGLAVKGVEIEVSFGGERREVTTNAGGVALVEPVTATSAAVSVIDPAALEAILDPRWEKFRSGKAPKQSNSTEVVFEGGDVAAAVKAAVPHSVILRPPLGRILVELWDKTGRVRHQKRKYTLEGAMSFAGTTDDQGRLLQDGVFPGDYTLTLTLEHLDGKDEQIDTVTAQVVVLDAGAGLPEIRMIGAVPRVVLARLHFFFNTSKAFLLPTALPGMRKLRQLYFDTTPAKLLVVGHADTKGGKSFNDGLSLSRAKATIAFLKDDADTWLDFYETSVPDKQRWGAPEDRMMILSMSGFEDKPVGETPVHWFQRTRELKGVDGEAGPETRGALIREYMSLDGVSLEGRGRQIDAIAHGCGENFPLDESGTELDAAPEDSKRDPADRRVDLFFFDKEFGIVPAPPGQNSAAGSTQYPAWRKRAAEIADIHAGNPDLRRVIFVELADAHFRTNSAVILPEGEAPSAEKHDSLTAAGVFATAIRYASEHLDKKLFVAGHTDTEASVEFNQKLSEERGECALALLLGGEDGRDTFARLCDGRHTVADYKQILSWVPRAFPDLDFDCDPGNVNDNEASGVEPVRRFQRAYNRNKDAIGATAEDLDDDGSVGELTWGAFFDCYEHALRLELDETAESLEELREDFRFADDDRRFLGFSEHFPIEELGVENFRSQTNRRVEILFFDPGEEPDLKDAEEDPETSELYLPGRFEREPLEVDNVRRGGTQDFVGMRGTTRFSANSDFPKPTLLPAIRAIQERLAFNPTLSVLLIGHADGTGVDTKVDALSLARAEAVAAWLVGDDATLTAKFKDGGVARKWGFEEIQWMLQATELAGAPCYTDRIDGYPGPNTLRALEYFQVKESLPITGLATDETLALLVQRYLELADEFVAPIQVTTVGAGAREAPVPFGAAVGPVFPDDAPQRLRRVEGILFQKPLNPSADELATDPTVYKRLCRRSTETLDLGDPPLTIIALTDEDGAPLVSTSFEVLETNESGDTSLTASGSTDARGVATVLLPEGHYMVRTGKRQSVVEVSFDEFGGQMMVVLAPLEES